MLMPELLASGAMVVERDPKMLQEIAREFRRGDSARKLGADSVRRGRMIGAHYMIAGSFMLLGREWILDVQINDLASGLVRERMTTRVPADSLLAAMSSLGVRVAAGVSRLPPVAPPAALDSLASLRARLGIPDRTPVVRR